MTRKLLFENVTCSRCAGSGHYSYCQIYGTTCFKCAGDGVTLTARGKAAQAWLTARRKKPGREVVVGDTVLIDGIPGFSASKWAKVTEITGTGAEHKMVTVDKRGETLALNGFWDSAVRVAMSKEAAAILKTEALAYQATLTKAGTVAKRKTKKLANPS
jgi:hypothetical protein